MINSLDLNERWFKAGLSEERVGAECFHDERYGGDIGHVALIIENRRRTTCKNSTYAAIDIGDARPRVTFAGERTRVFVSGNDRPLSGFLIQVLVIYPCI